MPGNSRGRSPSKDWTGQTLFGKWTVEHVIGAGGTSTVLQARHRNGRRAALKVLHPHLAAHGRMRERFLREGRLANLVNHPGVVAVLDDFIADDGTAVLVLELVKGKTLAALAKESNGLLSQYAVVAAAREVLEIVAVAHEANVVHRDIKPENILLTEDGTYKLADFGLAGLCHELGMLTGTNQTLGTPAYMSPEQARGDALHIDARTDIWSLGATMFTLLTGRYVHAGSTQKNLVVAAATESAPPIRDIAPALDPSLARIIDRALSTNKEERFPNALAMLAELRSIEVPLSEERLVLPSPPHDAATLSTAPLSHGTSNQARTPLTKPNSARKRFELALAAVALAALIALVVSIQSSTASETATSDSPREPEPTVLPEPASSITTADAVVPAVPRETPRESPPAPEARRTPARPSPVKSPAKSDITPAATVSVPPRAPRETEPGLSVPDEVLDRRE